MPCDYKKYPPNWKTEIRPRILKRAGNKCEICGVENYRIIRRRKEDIYIFIYYECAYIKGKHKNIDKKYHDPIKIILTIAHLDHDPENWNVKDDRLKAMCQRCHLNYDRKNKNE